ncbi:MULTISPECIES: ABC transporter substrate-binding protein [Sanguibacter]|uniref:Sugar ABC transporter substrate-binding protein n=1 Tax=Sanguibacter inulinus TaxID=60922 RepID=A0A853EUX7_9MICO|nr:MULTISPECIES: sugar ABC transporter substrate-binding protein [Sanguibacter]MBF0723192.1 sugar ABC transporter substrate-binding protein [Sanguibacter inulinus]NYS94337.1 sugar ABC transporter substrate-binding protein [Sanguibacter inulinus]
MRFTSRTRFVAVGAVAALAALTACGAPGGGDKAEAGPAVDDVAAWGEATGTVQFWDTNSTPELKAKWAELIDRFEEANPDITVEYLGIPNSSYLEKVDNALASGEVPDVLLIGNDVAGFIARDAFEKIDGPFSESLEASTDPVQVATERENAPDGGLYKAPLSAISDVIWYRTDWVEAAGLEQPTSYDEFYELTEQMTAADEGRFGFAFRGGPGSMPPMFSMAYGMAGIGEFFTEDGQSTFDDPAVVAGLERYVSLFDSVSAPADLTNDYTKIVAAFGGGSAWSMHHNLGSYQDHLRNLGGENVMGVQSFPDADGVSTVTSPGISGLSILKEADNKAAGWKFVEFMATEGNSDWSEAIGQVPANLEAQKAPWVAESQPLEAVVALTENPDTQYLRLPTYLPEYGSILKTEMEPDFQGILQGTMTAQEFATKYADRFEASLADYEEFVQK